MKCLKIVASLSFFKVAVGLLRVD